MKKTFFPLVFLFLVAGLVPGHSVAQDTLEISGKDNFEKFQEFNSSSERSRFFFETPNRYEKYSAYDWLEAVEVYLEVAESSKDTLAVTDYEIMKAHVYFDLGDYEKSLALGKVMFEDMAHMRMEDKALLLDLLDKNYARLELYDKQIEVRMRKREMGLTKNVSFYDIYSNLGQHRKAMRDYMTEEKKDIAEDDFLALAIYNNNIGNYLRLDESAPTAMTYFKKAVAFLDVHLKDVMEVKSEKDINEAQILKGVILGNIGKTHVQLKEYEKAIPFLEESVDILGEQEKGKFSPDLVENTLEIAQCYLQMDDFAKATDYLSRDIVPQKTANILKQNRLYAAYYDKTGNFESATDYLKQNLRIRDSLDDNAARIKKQQLATVVAQEEAYSRKVIEEQKRALEKSRMDIADKDKSINLVFITLVFLLMGLAALVYAYLRSVKTQRLIADQKQIIENALVEKDSLLKEIHHRVKNNLQMVSSLLSLQTKNTRSKAAIEALEEGKSRVKAMALIHQKLYQNEDLSFIEMQGYIESLINSIQSVYKKGGHNINITIDAEGVELDIDRAIPFGLILNELVSNSFKYAFPHDEDNGKIYIHLRKPKGQEGFFEYTDNGVGLPEDTEERAGSSMGIRLMNRLANQLQTTLNTDKTAEGVRFWFNFK
ncbi:sensor histidine kinase [Maribacter sp. 2307ULW6-5]|uniref:sensor histidine kinase n=1 Tax=Maribacter sp. 2307ULW6-5 TaxID=3386275 RepID=UPI0039BCD3C8